MPRSLVIAKRTDQGLQRNENQDACGIWRDNVSDDHLLIVADGMGGAACGSAASQMAVSTIQEYFFNPVRQQTAINDRLAAAIVQANQTIYAQAAANPQCQGMGTTCVVAVIAGRYAFLAHVGDSRVYLIRRQRIVRLTKDHSLVQRMLDDGLIDEDEAALHPQRNVLQRALGPNPEVTPEVRAEPIELHPGDGLILCTDGLYGQMRDEEMFDVVRQSVSPEAACEALVSLANERGGPDNITIAFCRVLN